MRGLALKELGLARALRPLVLEHGGLEKAARQVRGREASLPPADALRAQLEQQRELQSEARADAQPLSPRLLSRRVRLPQRFRRPLRPSGAA